ncbi:MAG: EamA family transporter [Nocardioidaceae bacterium]|nr:EamA family transporter [Nocardioidaceae bacterium]NUS50549.1 EamA family transporter [Nocardioidaceae bacterium]
MIRRNPALGLTLVVVGALLFVQNAGVSRVALRAGVDPASLTTLRVTGTVLVLVVFAALFRPEALMPPTGRLAALIVLHGLVGVAALQWTYFVAIDRLPVGMALLLEYQAPLLVALWARFAQREQVHRRLWWGLALAWGGLALATGIWRGLAFDVVGVVAGVGAALCFATYFLVGEHGVGRLDPLRVIVWSFLVAAVALNVVHPLTRVADGVVGSRASMLGRLDAVSAPVWVVLAWIVVVGTVLPFALELAALRHLTATLVTMIAMLEPIGVNALGWAWFDEGLGPVELAGGLAVVAGIVLAQSSRRPDVVVEPPQIT